MSVKAARRALIRLILVLALVVPAMAAMAQQDCDNSAGADACRPFAPGGDVAGPFRPRIDDVFNRVQTALGPERAALLGVVETLIAEMTAARPPYEDDPDGRAQLQQLIDTMRAVATGLRAEMGMAPPPPARPPIVSERPPPTAEMPGFGHSPILSELAAQWRAAVDGLGPLFDRQPPRDDVQAMATWQAERDQALLGIVLLEEELAWAAAGAFSQAEHDRLAGPFRAIASAREDLARLADSDARVDQLLTSLRGYEATFAQLGGDMAATGKTDFAHMGMIALAHAAVLDQLRKAEGVGDALRLRLMRAMDEVEAGAAEVVSTRRHRGIEAIRAEQARAAEAAGLPPSAPFRIHVPASGNERRLLGQLLARSMEDRISGGVPVALGADFAEWVVETDRRWVRRLDDAEIRRIAGR